MKGSDLTVKGIDSQYSNNTPTVYCFKVIPETNKAYLPPRFNTQKREYKHVDFPEPKMKLRPDQQKIINELDAFITSQGDVACKYAFTHMYTGIGKTVILSTYALRKKLPILVIVNSDPIRQGWINTFKAQGYEAVCASGSTLGQYDICILSIQLAVRHKFSREDYAHYGTILADEADVLCTQLAVDEMVKMCPEYSLGCSATVISQNGLHKVLDIFWGPRKHWIVRQKSFDETCSMELKILHTPFMVESRRNRKNTLDWTSMAADVMNIDERNILIRNLCLLHQDKKILILCKRTEHVEILVQMLQEVGEDVSSYYGTDKSYYDAHILVATLSKAGRGYDDKQVSSAFDGRRFNMLILTMTMRDADQAMGRGLRGDNLLLYLLVDRNPTMLTHAENMKKINSKRGAKITEEYV